MASASSAVRSLLEAHEAKREPWRGVQLVKGLSRATLHSLALPMGHGLAPEALVEKCKTQGIPLHAIDLTRDLPSRGGETLQVFKGISAANLLWCAPRLGNVHVDCVDADRRHRLVLLEWSLEGRVVGPYAGDPFYSLHVVKRVDLVKKALRFEGENSLLTPSGSRLGVRVFIGPWIGIIARYFDELSKPSTALGVPLTKMQFENGLFSIAKHLLCTRGFREPELSHALCNF